MIQIQGRDLEILRLCYEQQFLLSQQIESYFFETKTPQNARRRLRELEAAGLIIRSTLQLSTQKALIRLSAKGLKFIEGSHPFLVPQVKKVDLRTFHHDAHVTEVRLRLLQFWEGIWIPERALKSEDFPQIPDGVIELTSGKRVAVEVENSVKGIKRFHRNLERWLKVEVNLILFVPTSSSLEALVHKYLSSFRSSIPAGCVTVSQLKERSPLIWTREGNLSLLSRRNW